MKILIVNSNYYSKISKNLVIGAKRKLHNTKFKISILDTPGLLKYQSQLGKILKNSMVS